MSSRNRYKLMTASGAIASGGCVLESMYVNNISSGTMVLYDGTSTSGAPISGTITPAAGFHFLGNLECSAGAYFFLGSGTMNVTFHIRERD